MLDDSITLIGKVCGENGFTDMARAMSAMQLRREPAS